MELSRCPLIANPPALILDSRDLTLLDLGSRRYLPSSDLPPACQVNPELLRKRKASVMTLTF